MLHTNAVSFMPHTVTNSDLSVSFSPALVAKSSNNEGRRPPRTFSHWAPADLFGMTFFGWLFMGESIN